MNLWTYHSDLVLGDLRGPKLLEFHLSEPRASCRKRRQGLGGLMAVAPPASFSHDQAVKSSGTARPIAKLAPCPQGAWAAMECWVVFNGDAPIFGFPSSPLDFFAEVSAAFCFSICVFFKFFSGFRSHFPTELNRYFISKNHDPNEGTESLR